jgi:equilibrative nucleoside transporter 1/2/3
MAGGDEEATKALLLPPGSKEAEHPPPPADQLGVGYLIFFTLGVGFLLPWNAYITAVDYFSYLYPGVPVDRVFSVSYMLSCLLPLLLIVLVFPKSSAPARVNTGLTLFTLALLVVPVMDAVYVKGTPRLYGAFDITVAATVLCGVADALVHGGVIGFAGELPKRYMQAVLAGTAASGPLDLSMSLLVPLMLVHLSCVNCFPGTVLGSQIMEQKLLVARYQSTYLIFFLSTVECVN